MGPTLSLSPRARVPRGRCRPAAALIGRRRVQRVPPHGGDQGRDEEQDAHADRQESAVPAGEPDRRVADERDHALNPVRVGTGQCGRLRVVDVVGVAAGRDGQRSGVRLDRDDAVDREPVRVSRRVEHDHVRPASLQAGDDLVTTTSPGCRPGRMLPDSTPALRATARCRSVRRERQRTEREHEQQAVDDRADRC